MKPSIVAALLLGLAPLTSLAQASDAPAAVQSAAPAPAVSPAAAPAAPWSLGAGVGWGIYGVGAPLAFAGSLISLPPIPTVHASLERAVAPGWWAELGFGGFADRHRGDAPQASGILTRDDRATATVNLGVRRALTRPGAPVCVSVDLALVAGYST